MKKRDIWGLLIIIIVLIGFIGFNGTQKQYNTPNIQINFFNTPDIQILGFNDLGKVTKSGPYGNPYSPVKIAIITGVHPLERNSHRAIALSLYNNSKSLNYSYYIYNVHVSKDSYSYIKGRTNGQLLAEFAVSDIKKNNFTMAVDIHSNRGLYKEKRFICVPINNIESKKIALNIINKIPWLVYYVPPKEKGPSSPNFVTIPLIKSGTPAMIYETYSYDSNIVTIRCAFDFISTLDKLDFGN